MSGRVTGGVVAVATVTVAVVVALLTTSAGSAAVVPQWRIVAQEGVPALVAVDALTPKSVWAVGPSEDRSWERLGGGAYAVAARWDGSKLHVSRLSNKYCAELSGVTAITETDVWAVGTTRNTRPPTPARVEKIAKEHGVPVATVRAWIRKGQCLGATTNTQPLVVHFDGRDWRRWHVPSVKDGRLFDIAAVAPNDVWAVGSITPKPDEPTPLVMHFNGKEWAIVPTAEVPLPSELFFVDVAAADDVWFFGGVGPYDENGYGWGSIVLRWHGGRWTRVHTPIGEGHYKAWMVGALDIAPFGEVWTAQSDALYDDGALDFVSWSGPSRNVRTRFAQYVDGNIVYDLAAVSRATVWLVGRDFDEDNVYPWVARLVGKKVGKRATPLDGLAGASLYGISALSPTDIWAVGDNVLARYSP